MAEKIQIDLIVDASGAVTGIRSAGQELDGLGKRGTQAQGGIAKMAASFVTAQAVIGAVTGGIRLMKDAIGGTISAASEFESGMIGVQKTLDVTGLSGIEIAATLDTMGRGFQDLSTEIPVAVTELLGIGEAAGQLGIGRDQILDFTEVVAQLGVTTNLTSEQASTQLARLANVTGGVANTNFMALGSAIVDLGNNFATTEAEILSFAQRIGATGNIVGLSQADILAYGAAFTSVGVQAEAGGTAIQKTFITIAQAVETGGAALEQIADTAGMTAQQFRDAFSQDAGQAIADFIEGLGTLDERGGSAFDTLDQLGLGSERTTRALLSAAEAGDLLSQALDKSSQAAADQTALTTEAELRFSSFESQLFLTQNAITLLASEIGAFIVENQALGAMFGFVQETILQMVEAVRNNKEAITEFVSGALVFLIEGLSGTIDVMQFFMSIGLLQIDLIASMASAWSMLIQAIVDGGNALGIIPDSVKNVVDGVADMVQGFDAGVDSAQEFIGSGGVVDQFQEGLSGLTNKITDATGKQIAWDREVAKTQVTAGGAAEKIDDLGDATGGAGDAAGEASEEYKKLAESFEKASSAQLAQDMANLVGVINGLGGAANLNAIQLEAAGKAIENFKKAGLEVPPVLEEIATKLAALKAEEAINKLVKDMEKLGKAAKQADADKLVEALARLGGVANLDAAQIAALAGQIKNLGLAAGEVPPELEAVTKALDEIENQKAVEQLTSDIEQLNGTISTEGRQAFENMRKALEETSMAGKELSQESIAGISDELDRLAATDPGLKDEIEGLKDEFGLAQGSAMDFGATIEGLSYLFAALGVDANSALGQVVSGFSMLNSQLPALFGSEGTSGFQNSILGDKSLGNMEKIQGAGQAAAQGIASVLSATSSGGAGASAAKGALSGAAAGAQIGGPIGAAVGAAAGAITGFFRGRGRAKLQKQIEDTVGAAVSEDLAKAIKEGAEEAGRTVEQQSLLNLGDIIGEVGIEGFEGGLGGATTAVQDLMQGIADGSLPAKEGLAEVGEAFSMIGAEVTKAGEVADAEFINMITQARSLGLEVPEIAAFVAEQLTMAASGITSLVGQAFEGEGGEEVFGGIQVFNAEDAQAQATLFAATFFATVEEVGLLEAVDAFEPAFQELKKKLSEFGGDVDFGGVGRLFQIAGQEEFRPLLEGVQGLDEALQGLSNTGFLTAESFSAFQQQAGSAFEQLTAAGLSPKEALQQMGPLLNNLVQASNEYGIALDADTQALVAQAEAAGVAFRVEPMQVMADTLVVIAELLGATQEQLAGIGGTATETGAAVQGAFNPEAALGPFNEGLVQTGENLQTTFGEDATAGLQDGIAGANAELGLVDENLGIVADTLASQLPAAAEEGNAAIAAAFQGTSEAVQEGLGPVVDKFETEIKGAGETTSQVIGEAFGSANEEIQSGLSTIEGTIGTGITGAAGKAADAVLKIASAAREAAEEASKISFPDGGGGGGGGGRGDGINAAVGFKGLLQRDTTINAHEGELVNIIPAAKVRSMRSQGTLTSAQGGAGGFSLQMGDTIVNIPEGAVRDTEAGPVIEGITLADLKQALRDDREDIVDAFKQAMFEQT